MVSKTINTPGRTPVPKPADHHKSNNNRRISIKV